jgi:hypothetical protein
MLRVGTIRLLQAQGTTTSAGRGRPRPDRTHRATARGTPRATADRADDAGGNHSRVGSDERSSATNAGDNSDLPGRRQHFRIRKPGQFVSVAGILPLLDLCFDGVHYARTRSPGRSDAGRFACRTDADGECALLHAARCPLPANSRFSSSTSASESPHRLRSERLEYPGHRATGINVQST